MKRRVSLILVSLTLCTLFIGVFAGVASASPEEGTLALYPSTVSWIKEEEPATYPQFSVKLNITDVTDIVGLTFSIHWDPTILNLSMPIEVGDFLLPHPTPPGFTPLLYTIDCMAGNLSEVAYGQLAPESPKTYTSPEWAWAMTLNFTFVGTPPSVGSPIDTDILIVKAAAIGMDTVWVSQGPVYHDFAILGSCHFHYGVGETLTHPVTIGTETYHVITESNSTVSNFSLNETYEANSWRGEISFNFTGPTDTTGFCHISIPTSLMTGDPWLILVNGANTTYVRDDNATHTFLYIEYTHSPHKVQIYGTWVVPEFPIHMIPLLLIIATVAAAIASKKFRSIGRRGRVVAE